MTAFTSSTNDPSPLMGEGVEPHRGETGGGDARRAITPTRNASLPLGISTLPHRGGG
jgi:hypothetical protein